MSKRILIADASQELIDALKNAPFASKYVLETALSGFEALKKIETFHPDLVLLDLFLPEMHGIEILKILHERKDLQKIGVIISSAQAMIQNYHASLEAGAQFFLAKPFKPEFFFFLAECFFSGTLHPAPFVGAPSEMQKKEHGYLPPPPVLTSYVKFWGTRGSNPVSGTDYVRFGGNTVCLEIRHHEDLVIVDAGSGLVPFGNLSDTSRFKKIHLLLSHTHWDHIIAFPFFKPLYDPKCEICIWSPVGFEKTTEELFTDMLTYGYFPVRFDDIQAKISFHDLREGPTLSFGSITLISHYACHPGPTLCFKFQVGNKTVGYATDNEVFMGYHGRPDSLQKGDPIFDSYQSLIDFYQGCDLLVHEAQYSPAEYQKKVGWGHSSFCNAALLVKLCSPKEWIVTHHDPSHTDQQLFDKFQSIRDILQDLDCPTFTRLAFDGLIVPLE